MFPFPFSAEIFWPLLKERSSGFPFCRFAPFSILPPLSLSLFSLLESGKVDFSFTSRRFPFHDVPSLFPRSLSLCALCESERIFGYTEPWQGRGKDTVLVTGHPPYFFSSFGSLSLGRQCTQFSRDTPPLFPRYHGLLFPSNFKVSQDFVLLHLRQSQSLLTPQPDVFQFENHGFHLQPRRRGLGR